jgi:CubicO group peptidase (beta-lactamase class C family)
MITDLAGAPDLRAAIQTVGELDLGIEGIYVHVRGRAPIERHWVADIRRDTFSISKTFASVAIGIAQAEGLLDLDDSVLTHLPQLATVAAPRVDLITIKHLLLMSSGIVYRWDEPDAGHDGDPAREILTTPVGAVPGTT